MTCDEPSWRHKRRWKWPPTTSHDRSWNAMRAESWCRHELSRIFMTYGTSNFLWWLMKPLDRVMKRQEEVSLTIIIIWKNISHPRRSCPLMTFHDQSWSSPQQVITWRITVVTEVEDQKNQCNTEYKLLVSKIKNMATCWQHRLAEKNFAARRDGHSQAHRFVHELSCLSNSWVSSLFHL